MDVDRWLERASAIRVLIWTAAIPISYFYDWLYSVAFVAICSLYANWASDFAAWRSDASTRKHLERIDERLREIEEKL